MIDKKVLRPLTLLAEVLFAAALFFVCKLVITRGLAAAEYITALVCFACAVTSLITRRTMINLIDEINDTLRMR